MSKIDTFRMKGKKTGGRGPGSLNKTTSTVKQVLLSVFNEMQEEPKNSLKTWAVDNQTEFYKLAGKLIPTEIKGDIKVTKVELIVRRTKNNIQS